MSKTVPLKLLEPIKGHSGPIAELVFREPRYGDLIALGELTTHAYSEDGVAFTAERNEVIESYLERLLVAPENFDPVLLKQMCLADGLAAKRVLYDFFGKAREQNSARGQATSSST